MDVQKPFCSRSWESRHWARGRLGLHRHRSAYAALVLEGRYEELSVDGHFGCQPGMLVVHPSHHAHADAFGAAGARVLNLTLPPLEPTQYRVVTPTDPSSLERLMRVAPQCASLAVMEELNLVRARPAAPWVSRMARLLRAPQCDDERIPVARAASAVGKTPAHASRAFKSQFGTGPAAYRREFNLRLAIALLQAGHGIAEAAAHAGFSDQSHLGRELKKATGRTPRQWRMARQVHRLPASNPF